MKSKCFFTGIFGILLVFGLFLTSCDDPPSGGGTTYTVSFNSNGGSGSVQSITADSGSSITLPSGSGLSKSNYTFGGWNTNSSGTGTNYNANSFYTVNGNITLYAKWNPVSSGEIITLTPNDPYGWQFIYNQSILNGAQITEGDEYIFKYSFSSNVAMDYLQIVLVDNSAGNSGYKWEILSDYVKAEEDITANTVISGEVKIVATGTATDNSPSANRLVFQTGTDTHIQPTLTFTTFELKRADEITYTVTFDINGGIGMPPASQTVRVGTTITIPSGSGFSKSDYVFSRWYSYSSEASYHYANEPYTVYGDVTFYAVWSPSGDYSYTVTFDSNGGSAVESQTINEGETAVRPTNPISSEFSFDNWYSDSELTTVYDFSTPVTDNITLYAKWNPITYTVTFDNNGGGATESQTVLMNDTATEPPYPSKGGYTFAFWYSDPELTTMYNFSTPVIRNITLYAKWIPYHIVTFNTNEGSSMLGQAVNSGEPLTRPSDPTKSGYTFDNWYSDSALTTVYDFSTPVTDNITLYAKWIPIYTVTFNSNEGSAVQAQSMNSGGTATRPANPTKSGYTFDDWYSDSDLTAVYNFSTAVTDNITLYAKWIPQGSAVITIGFLPDAAPVITGPTIYISGDDEDTPSSATITLENPARYNSINWYIPGTSINASGASITLSAANTAYNAPGEHALTVEVTINGVPYGRTIIFTVEE